MGYLCDGLILTSYGSMVLIFSFALVSALNQNLIVPLCSLSFSLSIHTHTQIYIYIYIYI